MDTLKLSKEIYHVSIDKQPTQQPKKLLGLEYDTIILFSGFIVPILSFFLGFLLTTFRDRFKSKKELRVTSETFFIWVGRSLKAAKILLKEIENKEEVVAQADGFNIGRPDFVNLRLDRLIFNQETIYKSLVDYRRGDRKQNIEDYSQLVVNLDFLKGFQENLHKNFETVIKDFKEMLIQWNNYLKEFHQAKHNLIGRRVNEISKDSPLSEVNNIFNNWYNSNELGLSSTVSFLKKLETTLKDIYTDSPLDDEVTSLLYLTQQLGIINYQYEVEKSQLLTVIKRFHSQLEDAIQKTELRAEKIMIKKFKII